MVESGLAAAAGFLPQNPGLPPASPVLTIFQQSGHFCIEPPFCDITQGTQRCSAGLSPLREATLTLASSPVVCRPCTGCDFNPGLLNPSLVCSSLKCQGQWNHQRACLHSVYFPFMSFFKASSTLLLWIILDTLFLPTSII